jgi:hypothetical protein
MPYYKPPLDISKWVPGMPIRPMVVPKPILIGLVRSPVPDVSPPAAANVIETPVSPEAKQNHGNRPVEKS